jgi:rare lipoprotein A
VAASFIIPSTQAMASNRCGRASWYALHSKTASGERMVPSQLTAANRHFDFGTRLKVVNQRNGRSVVVRINDRGPFVQGRVLDLSRGAARMLGFLDTGVAKVCYSVVG